MDILRIYRLLHHWVAEHIPDSLYISKVYPLVTGKPINLRHPKTFNEKIQWIKVYDRKRRYIEMADKLKSKDFICLTGADCLMW